VDNLIGLLAVAWALLQVSDSLDALADKKKKD
jgi:hypothetical protein